jgi:hypothetical protein
MTTVEDILVHHGVKGMKWGVRRPRGTDGRVKSGHGTSADAERARKYQDQARKSGTHTLANAELDHLVRRLDLEQRYTRLASTGSKRSAGAKFAKEILVQVGKQQISKLAADAATKGVQQLIKK